MQGVFNNMRQRTRPVSWVSDRAENQDDDAEWQILSSPSPVTPPPRLSSPSTPWLYRGRERSRSPLRAAFGL